jgi:DDE domain
VMEMDRTHIGGHGQGGCASHQRDMVGTAGVSPCQPSRAGATQSRCLTAERGIDVSYETVRRWALKFGSIIARKLRRGRPRPDGRWHLDEVFVSINGRQLYVWRAVDSRLNERLLDKTANCFRTGQLSIL